jgi:ABC transporter substrate binding protein
MRRREVLKFLTATPLVRSLGRPIWAAEPPKFAIFHSGFPNRTPIHLLIETLAKFGYENSRTAKIDFPGGEADPIRPNNLVAQIAALRPDVVTAITSPAAVALKDAKLSLPVVFAFVPDPVGLGIVDSIAQPGGNFTGVTYSEAGVRGKRLERAKSFAEQIHRAGFGRSMRRREFIRLVGRTAAALVHWRGAGSRL